MLAINHRLFASRNNGLNRVRDRLQVLGQTDAEGDMDMIVPAFGDQTNGIGGIIKTGNQTSVIGRRTTGPFGHAERNKTR